MNELKLISNTVPAEVTFNYDEINAHLDAVLTQYSGLVFTEDTVADCKKTITELKKGQKSLNDFKIKTKKTLTEAVTAFEKEIKVLLDKFDTVIIPISDQADKFEITRKANKKAEIEAIIDKLSDERFLSDKYYDQLVITEQMLNKAPTIKAITADLTKQADTLLAEQNMEKANIELIKSKVELANAQYGVTLLNFQYLRLLEDGKDVASLIIMINENAESTKFAAEKAEADRLAIEARKAERLAKIESDRLEDERIKKEREIRLAEIESSRIANLPKEEPKITQTVTLPVKEVVKATYVSPNPHKDAEPTVFTEIYAVDGTEVELNALESFLNANEYEWKVVGE